MRPMRCDYGHCKTDARKKNKLAIRREHRKCPLEDKTDIAPTDHVRPSGITDQKIGKRLL